MSTQIVTQLFPSKGKSLLYLLMSLALSSLGWFGTTMTQADVDELHGRYSSFAHLVGSQGVHLLAWMIVLMGLAGAFLYARRILTGQPIAEINPEGVLIRNALGTKNLLWSEIKQIGFQEVRVNGVTNRFIVINDKHKIALRGLSASENDIDSWVEHVCARAGLVAST